MKQRKKGERKSRKDICSFEYIVSLLWHISIHFFRFFIYIFPGFQFSILILVISPIASNMFSNIVISIKNKEKGEERVV